MLHPVILSGGCGTRLWPKSRRLMPKQLQPLISESSLLQETVLRLSNLVESAAPVIVCNHEHRFLVAEQLQEIGVTPQHLMLEPEGRNTAPAAAAAAIQLLAEDEDALLLVLAADHLIQDVPGFHAAIERALPAARQGQLVTFGIVPHRAETGYGYIQRGGALEGESDVYHVAAFVEKPDAATAQRYVEAGEYFWNSGIFLMSALRYLEELERFCPDVLATCRVAVENSYHDLDFCRLDETAFCRLPSISIDNAVMEKTAQAAVVPIDIGWSDIGSWTALWEAQEQDADGNVLRGEVYVHEAKNCYINAEKRLVTAVGVDDLVIVETADAVLVAHKDKSQDVKKIVEQLQREGRSEPDAHRQVYRPWGSYEGTDRGERFQVKRLIVKPGGQSSMQRHHHRSEHWVVVSGTAEVTCDGQITLVSENESIYIPLGATHRIHNPGRIPLHFIEVQSGSYLGEDDIVRTDDAYGRTKK